MTPIIIQSQAPGGTAWLAFCIVYGLAIVFWVGGWGIELSTNKRYGDPARLDAIMILLAPVWPFPALWFLARWLKMVIWVALGKKDEQ
jgi:hypothetical protein